MISKQTQRSSNTALYFTDEENGRQEEYFFFQSHSAGLKPETFTLQLPCPDAEAGLFGFKPPLVSDQLRDHAKVT